MCFIYGIIYSYIKENMICQNSNVKLRGLNWNENKLRGLNWNGQNLEDYIETKPNLED